MGKRRQLAVFFGLVALNAALAFSYLVLSQGPPQTPSAPAGLPGVPRWVLGLANAGIIVVFYGGLGLAGLWFTGKLGLPGVFREGAGWRRWFWRPLVVGLALGLFVVVADRLFAVGGGPGIQHPPFPLSIIASATAGIGEEILFRLFVLGLWAFLFNLALRRWRAGAAALWIGNVIAAFAFAAGHLPALMALERVTSIAQIPPPVLVEGFLINVSVGLVAGWQYIRQGLVAAVGVHFWTDVVWHVLYPFTL